ncbi:CinA family protein [Nesterenkonia pannonica]|uniref:CinA family protein n=1 Tax=Nesterenkonia pannonica TaxID=1548602 RepID=UPI002164647D|nr:CinA family protein [Nesterenkonia pannonica]
MPGASEVLQGGIVSYSVLVKEEVLEVPREVLQDCGAVDGRVAAYMARGAARRCRAQLGVSTTGVAGPAPHEGKDVGTVYLGLALHKDTASRLSLTLPPEAHPHELDGDWLTGALLLDLAPDDDVDSTRQHIRDASLEGALKLTYDLLLTEPEGIVGTDQP